MKEEEGRMRVCEFTDRSDDPIQKALLCGPKGESGDAYALGEQEKDAEGEEMLTCDRDVVRMLYAKTDSVKVRQMLESLFGSKCLPDETKDETNDGTKEPKPAEPTESNYSEKLNSSGHIPDPAKMVDSIIKDGFRDHNRLHIAAMAMQSIISNTFVLKQAIETGKETFTSGEALTYRAVAKAAFLFADALIEESQNITEES